MSKKDFIFEEVVSTAKRGSYIGDEFIMPNYDSYENIININYKNDQLKKICSF